MTVHRRATRQRARQGALSALLAASILGQPMMARAEPWFGKQPRIGSGTAAPAAAKSTSADSSAAPATTITTGKVSLNGPTTRLQYTAKPWKSVLEDVAKDLGLQPVLLDVPNDRFTRNDLKRHDKDEALRILQHELEPLGYKLVAKDKYLTVFRANRTNTEYQRAQMARPGSDNQVQPAGYDGNPEAGSGVVRTGGPATPEAAPQTSAAPLRVAPQHRPAVDISKDVYSAFESRSTLQDRGPHGLPSMTVWKDAPGGDAAARLELFTLEIDTSSNSMLVTADPAVARGVVDLVRRLDSVPRTERETTQVVTGGKNLPDIGKQLAPQLRNLKANASKVAWQANAQDPNAQIPSEAQQPGQGNPLQTTEVPGAGIFGNLRGDVTIQSIPDLNLLILNGNLSDVEQVKSVIRTIEQVAEGSQPEIRIHTLEHVSSEALTTLLTDLYTRLTTQQTNTSRTPPTINVVPVVQPNAILVMAPSNAIQAIIDLIVQLDQPSDPAAEVEVIRLKNAIASQVVDQLTSFYQDRPGLSTRLRVIADVRTNALIMQARPRDLEEVRVFVRKVDRDTSSASHQVTVIPLTQASATELAQFLTTALQSIVNPPSTTGQLGAGGAAGQVAQELRDTKSVILEFLSTNGDVQRLVKSGLLIDIRINGDPRTNNLLVTAPKESIPVIQELVRMLDQPASAQAAVKIFPLRNSDASATSELLTNLFEQQTENSLGVQLAGAANASSLVPLRFQPDPRSNSVIAFGSPESLIIVEAILRKLDVNDSRNRQTVIVKLRNVPAADIANSINTFLSSRRQLLQQDTTRISTFQLIEQDVVVVAEPIATNDLLISATPQYMQEILKIVKDLDSEPPQVAIQALLVEVQLDDTDEFGVELGFQDPTLFARSVIDQLITTQTTNTAPNGVATSTTNIISQSSTPGFLFNNGNPLGNNTAVSPGTVASQGLSNFALGRTNSDLGFGGLVLSASSDAVSVLVRALQSRRNVRVLSRPLILALDNQTASIQVGQQVPIVTGVTQTTIGFSPTVTQQQTGIILTVTPRISPEGQVVMVATAEKSGVNPIGVPIFTDTNGTVFESPIIDITTATSTVKVPDGQTVVIGGMITNSDTTIERKVPWLGDVPIIKYLFRFDSHTERRTELLIFLTPRIIYGDADLELVKQVESDRLHYFEEEAEAIAGPLFSVPPGEFGRTMGAAPFVYDVRSAGAPTPMGMPIAPTAPLTPTAPMPGTFPATP